MPSYERDRCIPSDGVLKKWTNYVNGWQERYFEIRNGKLLYYKSKADKVYGCRGAFSLKCAIVQAHEFDECEFLVSTSVDSIWYLKAENPEGRELWMKALGRDYGDSDYSSSSTKSHSRNPSVSSTSQPACASELRSASQLSHKDEPEGSLNVRITELEGYKTLCCDQMLSIERLIEAAGQAIPQTNALSLKATHLAMISNINQMIELIKRGHSFPSLPSPPLSSLDSDSPTTHNEENTPIRPALPSTIEKSTTKQNLVVTVVTSDGEGEDEFHDADEHSSMGSIDEGREAQERESRASSVSENRKQTPSKNDVKRNLPFGNFDCVKLSKQHNLHREVEELTMQQLKYALAGVENNIWTLFAEDGEMKMYKREVEIDGLPVDPLKAVHHVKGVSALEFTHYFFDARYKKDWDHTLEGMNIIERCSEDTIILHQKHKTVWPAASRESLFWSHMRRCDQLKNTDALDCYIVCNKDIIMPEVPLGTSSSVRVKLTVSMICETLIKGGKEPHNCERSDVSVRIIYVSQVHPGGWVPTAALRQVYKREYPKFLRTFTEYVLKNVNGKPLAI